MCCRANLACHLDMQAYSHSWENMAKVIACTAQEEECVLFTVTNERKYTWRWNSEIVQSYTVPAAIRSVVF